MIPHFRNPLWLVFVSVLLSGCWSNESQNTIITIKTSQYGAKVKVTTNRNLENVTLFESKTDSTGLHSFTLELEKPTFVVLQVGEKFGEVYICPGYTLTINENGLDYKTPLTFSGNGAKINNYISWVNSNVEAIKWANGTGLYELTPTEFLHRLDSLKATIESFHAHFTDSVNLSDKEFRILEFKNNIKIFEATEEYKFYRLNDLMNEKWEAHSKGQTHLDYKLPKELDDLPKEVPLDQELLKNGYGDYHAFLNYYWHNVVDIPMTEEMIGYTGTEVLGPSKSQAIIGMGYFPDELREYLFAFNIRYWLAILGITPETDSLINSFRDVYKESSYLEMINNQYNEWLSLAPGQPAPNFSGFAPNGKAISIKDLRGKLLYVDAWATWCGPCIAEIPFSKKLQQEFSNEQRIEFVNISLDTDKARWEDFLKNDKDWKGIHLLLDPDSMQSFYTSYKLAGIPGYVLIDQEGKIIKIKAPRPSEESLAGELKQLLMK